MAAVEITISGVLFDKVNRTTQNVVIIGEASLTGVGVGGGPIYPPATPPSGNRPSHPIALPGDPWWGHDLHPEHPGPILPPQPIEPPPGNAVKPPPDDGGWGYFPEYGWGYFPKASEPGPKQQPGKK